MLANDAACAQQARRKAKRWGCRGQANQPSQDAKSGILGATRPSLAPSWRAWTPSRPSGTPSWSSWAPSWPSWRPKQYILAAKLAVSGPTWIVLGANLAILGANLFDLGAKLAASTSLVTRKPSQVAFQTVCGRFWLVVQKLRYAFRIGFYSVLLASDT